MKFLGKIIFQTSPVQVSFVCLLFFGFNAKAQCPANIDFESVNFSGWQCYAGFASPGSVNLSASAPLSNRHVVYSADSANGVDFWGGFPKTCPNGSN